MTHEAARPLTENERMVAEKIVRAATIPGIEALVAQLGAAGVRGGTTMFLDLTVADTAPAAHCPDGPLPVRAFVTDDRDQPVGEILVWIDRGYLSALEFAWVTDDMPDEWPSPTNVSTRSS